MAVDHEGLVAVKPEAVAGAHRLQAWSAAGDVLRLRRSRARRAASRRRSSAGAADFCAALPPRDNADAASTAVDRNGDGIRVRPISSITTPASTQPSPLPPKSSGTSKPENPISAKVFQSSRENPVASFASRSCRRCDTGALSLMRPRALSRSIDCSSVRTRAMVSFRLEVECVSIVIPGCAMLRRMARTSTSYSRWWLWIPGRDFVAPGHDGV